MYACIDDHGKLRIRRVSEVRTMPADLQLEGRLSLTNRMMRSGTGLVLAGEMKIIVTGTCPLTFDLGLMERPFRQQVRSCSARCGIEEGLTLTML